MGETADDTMPVEIGQYLAAFAAANPGVDPPTITKRPGGWYGIRSAGSAYVSPKRLREIGFATKRLWERALEQDRARLSTPGLAALSEKDR